MAEITINELMGLDEEGVAKLEKLAALGYSHKHMAMVLNLDEKLFCHLAADENSRMYYHIERGKIAELANEQMAIMDKAVLGDIASSQRLEEIRRTRGFKITKMDIFGGFETKKSFDILQEYLETGASKELSNDEQIYIEALTMMFHMDRKYGRRRTVEFFTKPPFNLKPQRAREMYDEAVNLFYVDRKIEKRALRHKYAEQLEEVALLIRDTATTPKDYDVYIKAIDKAAKYQELDRPDPAKLPAAIYQKPIRVVTLDTADVGLPPINRLDLGRTIDELNIPVSDKTRLRRDAMIEQIDIKEYLNELEEEGKQG